MDSSYIIRSKQRERGGRRAELPEEIARKLKSCSVSDCEEWRDLTSYTTYHCFPTGEKNQDRWEIWTQLLRKARGDDSWIPFRGSLVCSHHFRPEDFVNDPYSKRRKLIKNAIPSIFPTFTVDLDDPAMQVPEGDEGAGEEVEEGNDYMYAEVDPASYLDMSQEDSFEYETYETDVLANGSSTNNEECDDDIEILGIVPPPSQPQSLGAIKVVKVASVGNTTAMPSSIPQKVTKAIPGLCAVKSVGQIQVMPPPTVSLQKQQNFPRKSTPSSNQGMMMANGNRMKPSSSSQLSIMKQQNRPSVQVQGTSRNVSTPQKPAFSPRPNQSKYNDPIKSLPISLNPDLEIELVDPVEDLAAAKQRINELENENRSITAMFENEIEAMKQNYEFQILKLQRQLKQQQRLLSMNQSNQISYIPVKKPRQS